MTAPEPTGHSDSNPPHRLGLVLLVVSAATALFNTGWSIWGGSAADEVKRQNLEIRAAIERGPKK